MNKIPVLPGLIAILFFFQTAFAASDSIINVRPETSVREYSPGTIILLPDGRKTVIDESLPGGGWKTEEGVIIDRNGIIENSEQRAVIINPYGSTSTFGKGMRIDLPDGRRATIVEVLPNGDLRTDIGVVLAPDGTVRENASKTKSAQAEPLKQERSQSIAEREQKNAKEQAPIKEEGVKVPENTSPAVVPPALKKSDVPEKPELPKTEEELTLAQMLPLTRLPDSERQNGSNNIPDHKQVQKNPNRDDGKAVVPEREKTENAARAKNHKPEQQPEKSKKDARVKELPEKKPGAAKNDPSHKTKVGQELKIPPEAARTGNLAFLEGCWQGTRPEYFSKRTIRECFCFGANGSNGKRRVIDPIGKRKCIGATKAHLSPNGVLSVTSEGAYCSDGERWGQAEMVCRNSGPRTPCSWVFRDANNGSQSYQIPFIRVESCGR